MPDIITEDRPERVLADDPFEIEIAALERLDLNELRLQWRNRFGRNVATHLQRYLLLRMLAYRIQAEAFGGLSREAERILDRLATGKDIGSRAGGDLKPGTLLTREWQGRMEQVMAVKDGYAWRDRVFPSLSAAAFAITGTKWNGRRFFGLPGANGHQPRSAMPDAARSRAPRTTKHGNVAAEGVGALS
jgi:DUF2924 family protein